MKAYPSLCWNYHHAKYWILYDKAVQNSGKWCENRILGFLLSCYLSKALFILYRIAFAPPRKPCRIRLLFPHKNGWGSKVERHIPDRFCVILWCNVNAYSDHRAPPPPSPTPAPPGNKYERVLEPTETEVNFQEYEKEFSAPNPLVQPSRHDVGLCKGLVPAWAVAVHIITDRFSWNHKDLSCIVWTYSQGTHWILQSWSYYVKINFTRHQHDNKRTKNRAWL